MNEPGRGCAYPEHVDAGVVRRSNQIHARLKSTASRHPGLLARIAALPMVARYQVAECRVGVVHGDAESLAGLRFDVEALDDPRQAPWLRGVFAAGGVDVFASTHTCLPAIRSVAPGSGPAGCVVNNGAAGAHVALLPVPFDSPRWQDEFLAQWPAGSPAWQSYFERIARGPAYALERALAPAPVGERA